MSTTALLYHDEDRDIQFALDVNFAGHMGCKESRDDPGESPFAEVESVELIYITVKILDRWFHSKITMTNGERRRYGQKLYDTDPSIAEACDKAANDHWLYTIDYKD